MTRLVNIGLASLAAQASTLLLSSMAWAQTCKEAEKIKPYGSDLIWDINAPQVRVVTRVLRNGRSVTVSLRNRKADDYSFAERRGSSAPNDMIWVESSQNCGVDWAPLCWSTPNWHSSLVPNRSYATRGCLLTGDTGEYICTEPLYYEDASGEHAQCSPPPDKLGQLKVLNSGMCLVARSGSGERPVVQVPCASYSDQVWILHYLSGAPGPQGVVQIINRDRNLCLVTRGVGYESKAVVTTCNASWIDQIWKVVRDPNTGYYQLINDNSELCLVARGSSAETQALQSTCNTQWSDQLWMWEGWFN